MQQIISNHRKEIIALVLGILLGILGFVLPLVQFIIAVGAAAVALLVFWKPEVGIYLVVALVPLLPTTPLLGLVSITVLSFFIRFMIYKNIKLRVAPTDVFVAVFGLVLVFSTITSYTVKSSLSVLVIYLAFIMFYFVLVNAIRSRQQLYSLAILLVLAATLISLYGIYQYKTGAASAEAWIDTTMFEDIKSRVTSTFGNPNVLGEYLVLIIPISVMLLWTQKGWFLKFAALCTTVVMMLCLILTYSRGAMLGILMALFMFAVLKDRRFLALCLVGLLLMPFVMPESVINRFASIGNLQDTSSSYRVSVWLGSLKIVKDYWVSGIGLGIEPFHLVYPKYSLAAAYAHHSHNIYIQLLVENGIIGLLAFLALLLVFYKITLTNFWRTRDKFISTFMIAAVSGLTGYLLQGMVDNIWYNYRVMFAFWVVIALGVAAHRIISSDSEVVQL